ncbi:hypothetical protein Bca101_051825 [Brassica carinata]
MVVYKEVLCSSLTSSTHNVVTITKTLEEVENEERVQEDRTLVNLASKQSRWLTSDQPMLPQIIRLNQVYSQKCQTCSCCVKTFTIYKDQLTSELRIYGAYLRNKERVIINEKSGYLMRTEVCSSNEVSASSFINLNALLLKVISKVLYHLTINLL